MTAEHTQESLWMRQIEIKSTNVSKCSTNLSEYSTMSVNTVIINKILKSIFIRKLRTLNVKETHH